MDLKFYRKLRLEKTHNHEPDYHIKTQAYRNTFIS